MNITVSSGCVSWLASKAIVNIPHVGKRDALTVKDHHTAIEQRDKKRLLKQIRLQCGPVIQQRRGHP